MGGAIKSPCKECGPQGVAIFANGFHRGQSHGSNEKKEMVRISFFREISLARAHIQICKVIEETGGDGGCVSNPSKRCKSHILVHLGCYNEMP